MHSHHRSASTSGSAGPSGFAGPSGWSGRATTRMLAVGSVSALLAVAGCTDDKAGSDHDKQVAQAAANAAAAAGPPVIDEAAAKALMTKITAANNKANTTLDPDQVAGYEAEASAAADAAGLRSYVGRPMGEFDYELESLLAPSAGAGTDFFVADTRTGSATEHYPLILAKASGGDWRVVHSAPLAVPLPEVRKGGAGSVEVVPADDPGQTLLASPTAVAAAHAASLGQPATTGPFAGDAVSAEVVDQASAKEIILFEGGQAPDTFTVAATVAPFPVRALRTADGGALVAYTTRTDFTATKDGVEADLGPMLTKLGGRTPTGKVTVSALNMWWTKVPAKGKGDKVTVLGGSNQPTEVK